MKRSGWYRCLTAALVALAVGCAPSGQADVVPDDSPDEDALAALQADVEQLTAHVERLLESGVHEEAFDAFTEELEALRQRLDTYEVELAELTLAVAEVTPEELETARGADPVPGCPRALSQRVDVEQTARCLHEAWKADDPVLASRYATPTAVEQLFEFRYDRQQPEWEFSGCGHDPYLVGTDIACWFYIPDDFHGVQAEFGIGGGPSVGNIVEQVEFIG